MTDEGRGANKKDVYDTDNNTKDWAKKKNW
jgi:hypothetical protein